jgi:hypothetical protein
MNQLTLKQSGHLPQSRPACHHGSQSEQLYGMDWGLVGGCDKSIKEENMNWKRI